MKQDDSKDKSSVVFIGKGVIILSIIITASLSFVLGFFVGESIHPQPVIQTSVLPQQNVEPVKKEDPAQQPAPVKETLLTPVSEQTPKASGTEQVQESKKPKPAEETQKRERIQKPQEKIKSHPSANPSVPVGTQKEIRQNGAPLKQYTVQVEAFKHVSFANSLRDKLNKKGYKASVTSVKTKKHEKLYKVIVGDFETRKEADAFSSKLKKSENLQHAFVIPKNDQEVLR
jgi:cell division protein FtsN